MRNLILFAVAFSVVLTEADVEQLGYDVTENDFKNHFGIPEDSALDSGFVKNENFTLNDLSHLMNEEETSQLLPKEEVKEEKPEKQPKAAKKTAEEKEAEKQAAKQAKEDAKAKAKADKEAAKAAKQAETAEPKKPGVIASILEIIKESPEPINESGIVAALVARFPEKTEDSMRNTVKAQIGGKAQPLRMEQEKNVTFKIEERVLEEGKKAVRFYSIA